MTHDLHPQSFALAPPRPTAAPLFSTDDQLALFTLMLTGVLAVWKFALAVTTPMIWEEAHFVVLGRHLDLAYPDAPVGWPLFARLCTGLFGWSIPAVRLPGLIASLAFPFVVYWAALPIVERRNALWAAVIALLCPGLGFDGVIFYPELGLQMALVVMLGAMVRAMTPQPSSLHALAWWMLAGEAAAMGALIHFRFVLVAVGVLPFLVLTPAGRKEWRGAGLWLALGIASLGLAPSLIYNFSHRWPSLTFQIANRPGWGFQPKSIGLFALGQAVLATPVFFIAFIVAILGNAAPHRDERRPADGLRPLFAYVGGVVFFGYAGLALVDNKVMPHWPLLAYAAAAPLAPEVLIRFADGASSRLGEGLRRGAIGLFGPVLTLLGAAAALAISLAWNNADRLPYEVRSVMFTKQEDWSRIEPLMAAAKARLAARYPGVEPVIAASGHVTALRLEFPLGEHRTVYSLDDPYDEFTRFSVLRHTWAQDEAALVRDHLGAPTILVLPDTTYLYNSPAETEFNRRVCARFRDLQLVNRVELPPGRTSVAVYTASVGWPAAFSNCPLLPRLYIGQPKRGAGLMHGRSVEALFGLASDPAGVAGVEVILDGAVATRADYGRVVSSAPPPYEFKDDPGYPALWFGYSLPGPSLTKGVHHLSLRARLKGGGVTESDQRTLYVD